MTAEDRARLPDRHIVERTLADILDRRPFAPGETRAYDLRAGVPACYGSETAFAWSFQTLGPPPAAGDYWALVQAHRWLISPPTGWGQDPDLIVTLTFDGRWRIPLRSPADDKRGVWTLGFDHAEHLSGRPRQHERRYPNPPPWPLPAYARTLPVAVTSPGGTVALRVRVDGWPWTAAELTALRPGWETVWEAEMDRYVAAMQQQGGDP